MMRGLNKTREEGTSVIESYGYGKCTSCQKTDARLSESGVEFSSRDFFRQRFTPEELGSLLDRAGLTPREVVSKRSRVYKARPEEIEAMSDDELLDAMVAEPALLRRPIVIAGSRVVVGHNESQLADLIEQSR
jgi:arsenate reductase